jgi:ATP-dependent Lon protease
VLAIGGLKEKLLAAQRGGIRRVLIPTENERDLKEIPESVKSDLEIIPVKWMDQVLEVALERQPHPVDLEDQDGKQERPLERPDKDGEISISAH